MQQKLLFTSLILSISLFARVSSACPLINNLIDFNCDGKIKITVTGDSLVYGRRDIGNRGGYVARLAKKLPGATVEGLGIPGITSGILLRSFKRELLKAPPGQTQTKSRDADIFVIDVGRNDYNDKVTPPATTTKNIKRLVAYLSTTLRRLDGAPPLFVVAHLAPTTRSYQRPFITAVNRFLSLQTSASLPAYLHFEELDSSLISSDGIHPSPAGYAGLEAILENYIKYDAQVRMRKILASK